MCQQAILHLATDAGQTLPNAAAPNRCCTRCTPMHTRALAPLPEWLPSLLSLFASLPPGCPEGSSLLTPTTSTTSGDDPRLATPTLQPSPIALFYATIRLVHALAHAPPPLGML
ncbi:uncharacterized protein PAN0_003c1555 [Moesziomyces antarcticus]|uniref:uncharacterized protein n=1 Tax=Pseudozyma antarctica TaxID=84753 RepID=UPI000719785D|nr:uncharacterized protein PAN0_003c1555 [Moesziomyces antarcticus]GAK63351.1 hypothetical protein PAN0_003c1555 [Moesziomyces antarcticus]